jgi:molybdopterin synthase catalytic subunit
MANAFCEIRIVTTPLAIPSVAKDGTAGAVIDFLGVVRRLENGEELAGIEYEANEEMALHQLRKIARRALRDFDCQSVTALHRIGFVPVGDASLFVRVTAAHRAAAFDACSSIIEQIKQFVPIWKRPVAVTAPERSAQK